MKPVTTTLLASIFFLLTVDVCSQASRGISAAGRRMDDFDNQRRRAERDGLAREMGRKKPTKEELENNARINAETREDLEGLQRAYNDGVAILSGGDSLKLEAFEELAVRANKHSSRLRTNIQFPKPEKDELVEAIEVPIDARKRLRLLCTRIYDLLTNPIIENPQVLNLEAATKARLALDDVIKISRSTPE